MPFITRKHRAALLVSAAIVMAGHAATPAIAGCNSGNVADTDLLSSANCQASAAGSNAVAVGFGAQASAVDSAAVGFSSTASGNSSSAYGNASTASGAVSSAYGFLSVAAGAGSSAYGIASAAAGDASSAYGSSSSASGAASVAIGSNTDATAVASVAIGSNASATAASSVAIGLNANASGANSVAIGAGSVASAPNTVSVGSAGNERRITNVAAGINPTDAVNVSQLSSIASGITAGLQSQIDGLQRQVNDNQREARGGAALALAASGLWFDPRPGKVSVAGAFGNFKGVSGLALGIGYAPTANWRFNGAVTTVPETGDLGVRAGAAWTLN